MAYQTNYDCISCGHCANKYPAGAIYEQNNRHEIVASQCVWRGECVDRCPAKQ